MLPFGRKYQRSPIFIWHEGAFWHRALELWCIPISQSMVAHNSFISLQWRNTYKNFIRNALLNMWAGNNKVNGNESGLNILGRHPARHNSFNTTAESSTGGSSLIVLRTDESSERWLEINRNKRPPRRPRWHALLTSQWVRWAFARSLVDTAKLLTGLSDDPFDSGRTWASLNRHEIHCSRHARGRLIPATSAKKGVDLIMQHIRNTTTGNFWSIFTYI